MKKSPILIKRRMCSHAEAYYVAIKLGSLEIMALVDTGAMVTTLNEDVIKNNPELAAILSHCSILNITGVGDCAVDVVGEINVPLKLHNLISEHHKIVVTEGDGGTFPCILGLDFLDVYQIQVDTVHRRLKYCTEKGLTYVIPLQISLYDDQDDSEIIAIRIIIIPARTGRLIDVRVMARDNIEGCVEARSELPEGCLVARSLNIIRRNRTKIEIINVLEEPLVIEKGQILADFEALFKVYRTTVDETNVYIEENLETIEESALFNLTETTLSPQQKGLVHEFL